MNRTLIFTVVIVLACICPGFTTTFHEQGKKAKPNFLIIIADDCTYNDLPLYRGKNAKTPNIDLLAREGLTFNQAYLSEAMCQPCRVDENTLIQYADIAPTLVDLAGSNIDEWMVSQNDPGGPVDMPEALETARKGRHLHGPAANR